MSEQINSGLSTYAQLVELRKELSAMKQRAEAAEAALKPKPLPEGLVPHAYQLASTIQNADYWYKAGHAETNTGKAVMCMAQAMFAWKNAALAKAEDCLNYEARIKASQEQEPFMWVTSSGLRIPDTNVQREIALANGWIDCYAAPVIQPNVMKLLRENAELTKLLAEAKSKAVPEGYRVVSDEILFGIVGSFGHGRAKNVAKLSALLGVSERESKPAFYAAPKPETRKE